MLRNRQRSKVRNTLRKGWEEGRGKVDGEGKGKKRGSEWEGHLRQRGALSVVGIDFPSVLEIRGKNVGGVALAGIDAEASHPVFERCARV